MYCSIMIKNQGTIVSSPMAHYLVTNGSRFKMSHDFSPLPLRSFIRYLEGHAAPCFLRLVKDKYVPSSLIHDYIYRATALSELCLWEFVFHFETKQLTNKNQQRALQFCVGHPSYVDSNEKALLASFRRPKPTIPLLSYYSIPDLENVGRYMDQEATHVSQTIARNNYAMAILCLFCPFRTREDLKLDSSYFLKLKSIRQYHPNYFYKNLLVGICMNDVLFNLQQCHNATKTKGVADMICEETEMFKGSSENDAAQPEVVEDPNLNNILEDLDRNNHFPLDNLGLCRDGYTLHRKLDASTRRTNTLLNQSQRFHEARSVFLTQQSSTSASNETQPHARQVASSREIIYLTKSFERNELRRISNEDVINVNHKADGTRTSMQKWAGADGYNLDLKQRLAFQSIVSTVILTYVEESHDGSHVSEMPGIRRDMRQFKSDLIQMTQVRTYGSYVSRQLVMFMTGPGGSGKSRVIDAAIHYTREYVENLGLVFTKQTIVVTALSGVAAVNINGETTQRACHTNSKTENITNEMIEEWKDTRLLIIDEISFADIYFLEDLNEKLACLCQKAQGLYGKMNIVFCGDFRQLPPVRSKGRYLYQQHENPLWEGGINVLVELDGKHRFKNDPEWGEILERFRNGCPQASDFHKINSRVVGQNTKLPEEIAIASYKNKTRNNIHASQFLYHLQNHGFVRDTSTQPPMHTLIIKANLQWTGSKAEVSRDMQRTIFSYCGDSDCRSGGSHTTSQGRIRGGSELNDPFLTLSYRSVVMINKNVKVKEGIANGTVCRFLGVRPKRGCVFQKEKVDGFYVYTINADDVEAIILETMDGKEIELQGETRQAVIAVPYMTPENRVSEKISMHQFPIVLNNATTGHKLQGESKDSLFVYEWNYGENWPYVVLSRVRTLNGLYLRKALNPMKNYSVDEDLIRHMNYLRNSPKVTMLDENTE